MVYLPAVERSGKMGVLSSPVRVFDTSAELSAEPVGHSLLLLLPQSCGAVHIFVLSLRQSLQSANVVRMMQR